MNAFRLLSASIVTLWGVTRCPRFFYPSRACRMTSCNRFRSIDFMHKGPFSPTLLLISRKHVFAPPWILRVSRSKSEIRFNIRLANSARIEKPIKKYEEPKDRTTPCTISFEFNGMSRLDVKSEFQEISFVLLTHWWSSRERARVCELIFTFVIFIHGQPKLHLNMNRKFTLIRLCILMPTECLQKHIYTAISC